VPVARVLEALRRGVVTPETLVSRGAAIVEEGPGGTDSLFPVCPATHPTATNNKMI